MNSNQLAIPSSELDSHPDFGDATRSPSRAGFQVVRPARVLVVDDQPANIQMVGSVLGNLGHEIIPATDGPTALKRMALRRPDLILLDLLLPGMDGCEVCRHLKGNERWRDIPVIFLSAADDKDLIVQAFNAGGVDYLIKPVNQAELVSRVRTQLALKNALDHLKQLAEDKDELLGILAHDLKNHLGGVQMSAQLLYSRTARLQTLDERSAGLVENILHTTGHLLSFVKEFLANAAADYGVSLNPVVLSLTAATCAAVERHQPSAAHKGQTITSDFPDEDVRVVADPSALAQVLDNLLSNAVKFSPSRTRIRTSVRCGQHHGKCLVQDEGPGFTEEDKARMFNRYARLSAHPTGNEPSSGLGLSIVRKLLHEMHGDVSCDSAPGNGATFTIRLPRQPLNH